MSAPLMAARMSAWVALLAALVVCGALAVLVFRNLLTLLLVLVALAVAGAALWLALSRSGAARYLGVAVIVLALVGAASALVVRDALDELVVLVLAFVIFGFTSRWAIRTQTAASGPAKLIAAIVHQAATCELLGAL